MNIITLLWSTLLLSSFSILTVSVHSQQTWKQLLQFVRSLYRVERKHCYVRMTDAIPQIHRIQEAPILNGFSYIEKLYTDNIDLTHYVETNPIIGLLASLLVVMLFLLYRSKKRQNQLRMRAEAEIKKLAYNDILTGLYNRHHFFILASHALKVAARENTRIGVLFIDLNDFKLVNNRFGRKVGDQVLAHVGYTLGKFIRSSDITARIGGEEFAVLLNNINNIDDVRSTRKKIEHEISRFIIFEDKEVHVSASIGMGIYPDDGTDIDTLLKIADSRMDQSNIDSNKSDPSSN